MIGSENGDSMREWLGKVRRISSQIVYLEVMKISSYQVEQGEAT